MVILLTGATGFIGKRLLYALLADGHVVIAATRSESAALSDVPHVRADFASDVDAAVWVPRLAGVDVVINAVGILRERGTQTFAALHERAPSALFEACEIAGTRRAIQISALGADDGAVSAYHTSKRAADRTLARLDLDWVVVQPSLVYGPGGTSAALFGQLAALPLIPVPGRGTQGVQPVHVDDVVAGIVALVNRPEVRRTTLPFVGPEPLTLRTFLGRLRSALGLGRALFLPIPGAFMRAAAAVGSLTGRGLLSKETAAMLERGNVGDAQPLEQLLGRSARGVEAFVTPEERPAAATAALLSATLPALRLTIAAMWLIAGIVSLGIYPVESSLRLLAQVGVTTQPAANVLLFGSALLDIALGIATIVLTRRRWLWLAQIVLVLVYTAIITVRLPELWLEPFGPVAKNVPILAALWVLHALDGRRWNT